MKKTVIVCVHYKNDEVKLRKSINNYFKNDGIVFVNTHSENCNDFFEFSGYKYGTDKILDSYDVSSGINILFINDTVFESHFTKMYSAFYMDLDLNELPDWTLHGIHEERYFGPLVPSCFFIISTSNESIGEINFHPMREALSEDEIDKIYAFDEFKFNKHIDNWLYPKGWFKGWYKASKYKKISKSDYYRKRLAIFLEYTLLERFESSGFRLAEGVSNKVRLFRFFDRLYCNVFKLKFRLKLRFYE